MTRDLLARFLLWLGFGCPRTTHDMTWPTEMWGALVISKTTADEWRACGLKPPAIPMADELGMNTQWWDVP